MPSSKKTGSGLSPQEKAFCKAFGARIAQRRRELGLTQVQTAAALGIAQQTYAHYEVGRFRVPVTLLPALARVLATDTNSLLPVESTPPTRGRATRSRKKSRKSTSCTSRRVLLRLS